MPGRFQHLEFDGNDEPPRRPKLPGQTNAHRPEQKVNQGVPVRQAHEVHAQAVQAYQWGWFEKALELDTRALRLDRRLIPAWVGQVQMLVELGEYHEARLWSDKALELFRNQGELLAAKAQACARLHDLPAALTASDASMQAQDSSPWRWEARGEVLLARNESRHVACFDRALAEPTADWFDRLIIGRILLFYRHTAKALQFLHQVVEMRPDHGYPWLVLGQCQAALGWDGPARDSLQRCLELAPGFTSAVTALREIENRPLHHRLWRRVRSWTHL